MIEIVKYIDPDDNEERLFYRYQYGNQPDQMRWSEWEEVEITYNNPRLSP